LDPPRHAKREGWFGRVNFGNVTGKLGRAVLHEIVAAARYSGKPFHRFNDKSEMTAKEAIELYELFDQHGIKVWIDGGWGVDALLGHQTRKHNDYNVLLCRRQQAPD
jgi:hypothetical protein